MIDIHCHMLPAIDEDGPPDLEEVLEMARIAFSDGIRQVVATPHVKGTLHPPEFIRERVDSLNASLQEALIPLEILPGAETSAVLNPEILKNYTINGTDYVLLEFPHTHLPQNADQVVFDAIVAGLRPIIAHPERNPSVARKPELLFRLIEAGALAQITSESLVGGFGLDAERCARHLLKKNAVHFLATDAHSSRGRRPVISQGVEVAAKIIGDFAVRKLVSTNPAAVIAGKAVAH